MELNISDDNIIMYVINNNKILEILANGIINRYNITNADSIGNPIKIFNNGTILTDTAELYSLHNNYAQKLLLLYSASVNLDRTDQDLSIHNAKELVISELDYFDASDNYIIMKKHGKYCILFDGIIYYIYDCIDIPHCVKVKTLVIGMYDHIVFYIDSHNNLILQYLRNTTNNNRDSGNLLCDVAVDNIICCHIVDQYIIILCKKQASLYIYTRWSSDAIIVSVRNNCCININFRIISLTDNVYYLIGSDGHLYQIYADSDNNYQISKLSDRFGQLSELDQICVKEARIAENILVLETFDNTVLRYDLTSNNKQFPPIYNYGFDYSSISGRKTKNAGQCY